MSNAADQTARLAALETVRAALHALLNALASDDLSDADRDIVVIETNATDVRRYILNIETGRK